MTPDKPKRKPIDWEAVERSYRAGVLSIREIGLNCGCSHTAINKRAKERGWTRNLTEAVRLETEKRLTEIAIADAVSTGNARETIEAAAATQVQVVTGHRASLKRLLDRIDWVMGILEREDKDGPSLEPRDIGGLIRDCSQAMAKAIPLQRQAFNISGQSEKPPESPDCDLTRLPNEQLDTLAKIAAAVASSKPS